jgi:hypothetical protein
VDLIIAVADPNADDVRALLERHLTFARGESPPEHVHALNTAAWADPGLPCSALAATARSWASEPSGGWTTPTPS